MKCKILWNKEYEQLQTYQKLTILATLKDDFNMAVCDSLLEKKKKSNKIVPFFKQIVTGNKKQCFSSHVTFKIDIVQYEMKTL